MQMDTMLSAISKYNENSPLMYCFPQLSLIYCGPQICDVFKTFLHLPFSGVYCFPSHTQTHIQSPLQKTWIDV